MTMGKEDKRRGGGGRFDRRGGRAQLIHVTTFPGRATFHAHYKMTGKCPLSHLRWPSGPSANKTRPHLGLFLHIYQIITEYLVLGAALIKKYSSYCTNLKKVPRVFFPKRVLQTRNHYWTGGRPSPLLADFVDLLLVKNRPPWH